MKHEWVPSTLGHGDAMCKHCGITNREAIAIGLAECDAVAYDTGHIDPPNDPLTKRERGRLAALLPSFPQFMSINVFPANAEVWDAKTGSTQVLSGSNVVTVDIGGPALVLADPAGARTILRKFEEAVLASKDSAGSA